MGSLIGEQLNLGDPRPHAHYRKTDGTLDVLGVVLTDTEGAQIGTASNPIVTGGGAAPAPANVLGGSAQAAGTIITIPAGRTWAGSISLAASLSNAPGGVAVAATPNIAIGGAGSNPAPGIILEVPLNVSAAAAAGNGNQVAAAVTVSATVSAAAGVAATLSLAMGGASQASGTATGTLY